MSYFPFFADILNKPGLIVGGGLVAERKINKLIPFGPRLTVIAPKLTKEIKNNKNIEILKRPYKPGDEKDYFFVIAATDSREVNNIISIRCQKQKIPVNVVDDPELCSFLFPSIVKEGKLTVGISTSGASPTAAIEIKERIRKIIPENFDEILDYLYEEREKLKATVKTEEERSVILRKLFIEKMPL